MSVAELPCTVLLDDCEPVRHGALERHLRHDGFAIADADGRPDVVVAGGRTALERWRGEAPVILLGADDPAPVDRVAAYRLGCSDYLDGPIDYFDLIERIRVVVRRGRPESGSRIVAGPIEVDLRTRLVAVAGRSVRLAQMEYALLAHLAADPYRVFTKEELLRDVWGYRPSARTRTLDAHVCRVRRKLRAASDGLELIENHWGVGYQLLA